MNVMVLYGPDDPVFYHRGKKPYGELLRHGHDVTFINNDKVAATLLGRMHVVIFIRRADSAGAALMVLCKAQHTPTILDLDDNFFAVPEHNPTYVLWGDDPQIITQHHQNLIKHPHVTPALAFLAKMRPQDVVRAALNRRIILTRMIEMADAVTVTVKPLMRVYERLNDNIVILPNCIDEDEWARIKRRSTSGLVIGWAGGNTHYDALTEIKPALRTFLRRNGGAQMVTVGVPELHNSLFKDLPRERLRSLPWMEWTDYQNAIASFDIMLAPAISNAFSKGKSAIRAMHANAVGIPVIGGSSTYKDYLKASGGGIVVSTAKEWIRALNKLRQASNRKQLGHQGQRYVYSKCTYQAKWHRWAKLCASLAIQSG